MPKLIVDTAATIEEYPDAKSYFVDDRGNLHVVGQEGNIAAFAPGIWQFVTTDTSD